MALPTTLKTPGVYIDEKNAFPNSVIAVETSVPAFIGYTEKAEYGGQFFKNKTVRIKSFMEFVQLYGEDCRTIYDLKEVQDPATSPEAIDYFNIGEKLYSLIENIESGSTKFNLYNALRFFYQNGGGDCYIISIGTYDDRENEPFTTTKPFIDGIQLLEKETAPTMIVIPDAVLFEAEKCYSLQLVMLEHCGVQKNRIAILDIYNGDKGLDNPNYNPIDNFRNQMTSSFLNYGAAYYPWLHTAIVQPSDVDYRNLSTDGLTILTAICKEAIVTLEATKKDPITACLKNLDVGIIKTTTDAEAKIVSNNLSTAISVYSLVMEQIRNKKNLLAPSAAIAGIYCAVDSAFGVWKAPANVTMSSVITPAVLINSEQLEYLNAPIDGKAVCAIRPYIGEGTMVWGAHTLNGSTYDYRFINVRRTSIMLEQSIKFAIESYIFEPNVKNTWISIEAMITNFLTNLWKLGTLAGNVPTEAFSVAVGLGSTMTENDIVEGKIIIEIKVAISKPSEFNFFTFQQEQKKS